jgi:glycosyltransferase involved in cell wall biosynthesis
MQPAKIEVIYPAVDPFFQSGIGPADVASVRSRFNIDRDYILCVGIFKPRKNHAELLKSFQLLLKSGIQSRLVIAGPMGEGAPVLRRLTQDLGIAQHVSFTGFVTDADLRALYSSARVYACPSLYEGFGFTVLEAMACGTPVVCSSATSLPEVAGQAALYFDPYKAEGMATQLSLAYSDDSVRASLIAGGRTNLLRFSWAETARQTLAVYHHALQVPLPRAAYA